ncbi:MAG: hypothetical protein M1829_002933 [Trizodia sp. TS-e1964]|nr:MAG: hypothetical protein M1829_002933 [Trizodia sp. TS-e1964]
MSRATDTQPAMLLNLPQEIRNAIYVSLLVIPSDAWIVVVDRQKKQKKPKGRVVRQGFLNHDHGNDSLYLLHRGILFTCKQICYESLNILYSRNSFGICISNTRFSDCTGATYVSNLQLSNKLSIRKLLIHSHLTTKAGSRDPNPWKDFFSFITQQMAVEDITVHIDRVSDMTCWFPVLAQAQNLRYLRLRSSHIENIRKEVTDFFEHAFSDGDASRVLGTSRTTQDSTDPMLTARIPHYHIWTLNLAPPSKSSSGMSLPLAASPVAAPVQGLISTWASKAHEHDTEGIPDGSVHSLEPIDTILWIHIFTQTLTYGLIFPFGMVLGIVRSRWHVPVQALGTLFAMAGYFLGHSHGGRKFAHNIHASFSNFLTILLMVQIGLGIYLRLHLTISFNARIRPYIRMLHGIVGKAMPLISWTQMLFGGITALGYCQRDHLGQCLAHFIMGSAFIIYGVLLTILLLVGQAWLKRTGRSQEFFDSIIIGAWGFVNTFTEHRSGEPWSHDSLQHTTMGVVWWCAGVLGIFLSRKRDGSPKRNLIPGMVLLITGWAMSGHAQRLPVSTMVHKAFGYTLMAAGVTRMVEIAFVLKDEPYINQDGTEGSSFQHIPTFLLYASGYLFMGATEEQMQLVNDADIGHVSYVLVLYSLAFLTYFLVNVLLHVYAVNISDKHDSEGTGAVSLPVENRHPNSSSRTVPPASRQIRDAEEFELDGLISDEDDEEEEEGTKTLLGGAASKQSQHVG